MKIYIDADACPVQTEVIELGAKYTIPVVLVKSISHFSHDELPAHVETVYVDKGAEMADFKIIQLIKSGDIIITQDYGLASICLGKNTTVLHQKGFRYTNENIDQLLTTRHHSAMARRAGHRTKGPKAFTNEDREKFTRLLDRIIQHA